MPHRPHRSPRSASALYLGLLSVAGTTLLLGSMTGCLISSENHTSYTGSYIAPATLNQIAIGQSTESVESILGAPTSKAKTDSSSVWRWDYTIHKSGEGSLLFLFYDEHSTTKQHSTYVEFQDGLVSKKWSG